MNTPLVSILIPLYNSETFIEETILSAINQSYKKIEVIIVDDGSTDSSLSIAKKYESDSVKVFTQNNKGASSARNYAFEKSSGELIQYLDADDILHQEKIAHQVEYYLKDKNDYKLINCIWGRFNDNVDNVKWENQLINKDYSNPIQWLIDSWNGLGMTQPGTWLCSKKIIESAGPWNETLSLNDDGEFFTRILLLADSISFVNDSKVFYRSNIISSLSNQRSKDAVASELKTYQLYVSHCSKHLSQQHLRKALATNFIRFIYQYYSTHNDLCIKAEQEFNKLKVGNMWPVGGKNFIKLAEFIGFKNMLKIKCLLKR